MPCSGCHSRNLREFDSEITIHIEQGIGDLTQSNVVVFPKITICIDCGFMQGQIKEDDFAPSGTRTGQASGPLTESAGVSC